MKTCFPYFELLLVFFAANWSVSCFAQTTTYTFSASQDDVFFTIVPNPLSTGFAAWPSQLADTRSAREHKADVLIENELNAPISFSDSATVVNQSPLLNGEIAWAKPRSIGFDHEPFIVLNFANRVGSVPQQISFDFAISIPLPGYSFLVFDTDGDSETLTGQVNPFSYDGGQDNGTEAHVTLSPIGSLDNLAKIRIDLGGGTQVGIDNLAFDGGVSADFDKGGSVDANDLATWAAAFGSSNGGDADTDGDTDGNDFLIWQRQYTDPAGSVAATTIVPEPTTGLLWLLCCGALLMTKLLSRGSRHLAR